MNSIIVLIIIGVLIWKLGLNTFLLIILGLAIVFLIFISIDYFKNKKYYQKIKKLTALLKQTNLISGSYKSGRKTIYYSYYEFKTTINSIYVHVHSESYPDSKVSITMKIGEQNYSIRDGSTDESINSFNENIKVIFIDTLDKTIKLLQDKISKIKDEENIKGIQQKTLVEKLAQDINNQTPLKKENLMTILPDNLQKDTNNEHSKKEKTLQATIEMQSKTLRDFQNKEASRIQYINEYEIQKDTLKKTISSQSNEIIELQNKLLKKEEEVKELINDFTSKINSLEEKIKKQKVVKTMTPLHISIEKQTINKTDGELIKRDSFDDF